MNQGEPAEEGPLHPSSCPNKLWGHAGAQEGAPPLQLLRSYQCLEQFLSRLAELQSEWLPQYKSGLFSFVLPGASSGIISFNFQAGLLYCINCNTCDSTVWCCQQVAQGRLIDTGSSAQLFSQYPRRSGHPIGQTNEVTHPPSTSTYTYTSASASPISTSLPPPIKPLAQSSSEEGQRAGPETRSGALLWLQAPVLLVLRGP
ncbi:unnamed protein product [Lota lota]